MFGWWSSNTDTTNNVAAAEAASSTDPQPPQNDSTTTPTPALSRDELAYEELKDLFSAVDAPRTQRAAAAAKTTIASAETRAAATADSPLYPSTMSCRQAFDQAFYCQSMGGQFNSLYRHGALRSCSAQWAQWRFCMRLKAVKSEAERRVKVREFYMERAAKWKTGPSSEEVWELRGTAEDEEDEVEKGRGTYVG